MMANTKRTVKLVLALAGSLAFVLALTLAAEAQFLQCGYGPCGETNEERAARWRALHPSAGKYCMTSPAVTGIFRPLCSYDDMDACVRFVARARARQILPWIFPSAQCQPNPDYKE
jgi:hypothetical protein